MVISSRQKVIRPTSFSTHFYSCSRAVMLSFHFYLFIHFFVARLCGAVEVLCETDRREDIERQTVSL